jgi:hypothetical protein
MVARQQPDEVARSNPDRAQRRGHLAHHAVPRPSRAPRRAEAISRTAPRISLCE